MSKPKKIIAVYPGRFHPFHRGHFASYMQMVREFGKENVIIATSGKSEPVKSPFSFDEKREMMILAGVPANKIVYTANPYLIPEVVGKLSEKERNETALVFGVSEKDMSEDPRFSFAPLKSGKEGFYRKYVSKETMEPMGTISETDRRPARGYIFITKTVPFKVLGKEAKSASEMRKQYATLPKEQEKRFIEELFGKYSSSVNRILNVKLKGIREEMKISEERVNSSIIQKMKDSYKGIPILSTTAHRSLSDFLKSLSAKELKMVGEANIKFASAMAWDRLSKTSLGRSMMSEDSSKWLQDKKVTADWLQSNLSLTGWAGPDEVKRITRKARGTGPGGSHLRAKMNNVNRRPGETHKDFANKVSRACEKNGLSCNIIASGEETKRDGSLSFWVDFTILQKIKEGKEYSQKEWDGIRQKLEDGIKETKRALDKELAYSRDLQDKKMVAFYRSHLAKLEKALKDKTGKEFNKMVGLEESFTEAQLNTLRNEYGKLKTIDPSGEGYKKMTKLLDSLGDKDLKMVSQAGIKFVSSLALNRVIRRGIK